MIVALACALPGTTATLVFGVLWLSALRNLHKAETERDRYWDMCAAAGLIMAASTAEKGRGGQR